MCARKKQWCDGDMHVHPFIPLTMASPIHPTLISTAPSMNSPVKETMQPHVHDSSTFPKMFRCFKLHGFLASNQHDMSANLAVPYFLWDIIDVV